MTFKELIYFLVDHDASGETIKDFCHQYDTDTDKDETIFYLKEYASDKVLKVYKCAKCGYSTISRLNIDVWNCCPYCGRKIAKNNWLKKILREGKQKWQ